MAVRERTFRELIQESYQRRRPWLAGLLVVGLMVGLLAPIDELRIASGLGLLVLSLDVLLEIRQILQARQDVDWYSTFQEAMTDAVALVEDRLHVGRHVHLRWLGVTQEAGWPVVQNLLLRTLRGELGARSGLSIELALLDPHGSIVSAPKGPDSARIQATLTQISRFAETWADEMDARGCTLRVHRYDFRPTWHSLLIDDDILFWSPCLPANIEHAAPQSGAEVVRADAGEAGLNRLAHFGAWFDEVGAEC